MAIKYTMKIQIATQMELNTIYQIRKSLNMLHHYDIPLNYYRDPTEKLMGHLTKIQSFVTFSNCFDLTKIYFLLIQKRSVHVNSRLHCISLCNVKVINFIICV